MLRLVIPFVAILTASVAGAVGGAGDGDGDGGRTLYRQHECGACHETGARPGMIPFTLAGLAGRFDETSLSALLGAPPDPMPVFDLSEEERLELARYLLATFP